MKISAAQCRAARGLTNITQGNLAARSGVSVRTIAHFEKSERTPIPANLTAIRAALEAAGVVFVDENGHGPGVRLRKEIKLTSKTILAYLGQRGGAASRADLEKAFSIEADHLVPVLKTLIEGAYLQHIQNDEYGGDGFKLLERGKAELR